MKSCMVMLAVEIKVLYLAYFRGVDLGLGQIWGKF